MGYLEKVVEQITKEEAENRMTNEKIQSIKNKEIGIMLINIGDENGIYKSSTRELQRVAMDYEVINMWPIVVNKKIQMLILYKK